VDDTVGLGPRELLDAFRSRQLSPVEVFDAHAVRIAEVDAELGAFRVLCLGRAADEARHAEHAYRHGGRPRPLEGLPFAAKDIFDTAGVATGYGSAMFAGHKPAADAAAVACLRAAGAILVGKTATHEFAWGITSVNPLVGTPRNPVDPRRVAGGSSGGSAVALASHQVPFALGSDTGGSVRIPSSFCGIAGLKPTFQAIARGGVWPLAASLDHVGAMARTAGDLAPWLAELYGFRSAGSAAPARIGVCPDLHLVPLAADVQVVFDEAVSALGEIAAGVSTVAFPGADRIRPTFATIQGAEAVISHRRAGLFPSRAAEYGDDVRGRLEAASAITLEQYAEATTERLTLERSCAALFEEVDVVITPITAVAPSLIEDPDEVQHLGRRMSLRDCVLPYTVPQDVFGLPACAVAGGRDASGLPVGVQLWGPRGRDARVVQVAAALESALGVTTDLGLRDEPAGDAARGR
jgi:aspartyl-tRNA(Asn)/glutamyl-tRNA(Gln) amidotransferase subunit A